MKINIFNRIFEISIKKRENKEIFFWKKFIKNPEKINAFIFILVVTFFFVAMLFKMNLNTYRIGDVAKSDIIAYKDVTYTRDILDDELKVKISQNTTPEYDVLDDVSSKQLDRLDQFLQNINQLDLTDNNAIREFIKDNNYNLTVDELKSIGISKSVKYYLYLTNILSDIYKIGIDKVDNLNKILAQKQIVLTDSERKLLLNFIEPNLVLNKYKTLEKVSKNMESLKNNKVEIKKGDLVVKKGDTINSLDYDNLSALGYVNKSDGIKKIVGDIIVYIVITVIFYNYSLMFLNRGFRNQGYYPLLLTMIGINFINVFLLNDTNLIYLSPFLLVPIVGMILTKDYNFTISLVAFNYIYTLYDLRLSIMIIFLSLFVIYINKSITSRSQLVKNSLYISLIQSLMVFGMGIYLNKDFSFIVTTIIFSLLSGLLVGFSAIGLLPYLENSFQILTDIKMLELSNFSNKLLKQLLIVAPGTFHHSLMVGTLAEAGAEAIGANSILCRVASYYHDIGKMQRPLYFVENQQGIENPHNKLKPSLSALIITSHTKDGNILGKSYGLPKEILDIILEHHGTTLVQYFYYKALENNENVFEEDFRYSGPKPRTKESGIIMLADTIEAAVRANSDKSNETIEKLVRNLIKSKIDDGQLSECNITLEEIEKVTKAFLNVIRGIYHERIQYMKGK